MRRFLPPFVIAVFCTIAATSTVAQDMACVGDDNTGEWIGGSEDASDIATTDRISEQLALVLNGNTYVSLFTLTAPTSVRIEAAGRGNGDPVLTLIDSAGDTILTDDDSGGNGAARAETRLETGSYCVTVTSYDGRPMTAFVRVTRAEQAALTPGVASTPNPENPDLEEDSDSPEMSGTATDCVGATDLGEMNDQLSISTTALDTPYVNFTIQNPTGIIITATNRDADPKITLFGPAGENLDQNDDFDGLNARIDRDAPLPAGRYCIALEAVRDDGAPIDLTIRIYDAADALTALYQQGSAAPPLDGTFPVTDLGTLTSDLHSNVQASAATTWFSLLLADPGLLLIEARVIGKEGDPWLVLFDSHGRQLAVNDDGSDDLNSLIATRVTAGRYLVGVKHVTASSGMIALILERFVSAP